MTTIQHIGSHAATDRWRTNLPLDFCAGIDGHATHGCVLSLYIGPCSTQFHLTPDDVRAIAALWLQTADEADLAAGRYTLKPEPPLEKITIPQDVAHALERAEPGQVVGLEPPVDVDQRVFDTTTVRYRGSWPPGDGGDWSLIDGLAAISEAVVISRCEQGTRYTPGPNALWVRPYTPSERARLPNCAVCRDEQTIWDESSGQGGRYAPCPSCCPADYEKASHALSNWTFRIAAGCAALNYYKAATENRKPEYVPSRVRLAVDVRGDGPYHKRVAVAGEYECESNTYGAVSVRANDGEWLGIKPAEFEPLAWRVNEAQS